MRWFSGFTRRQVGRSSTQTSRPRRRLPELEILEDRLVPTTTLYIDYGDRFPAGGLTDTVGRLRTAQAPGNPPVDGPDVRNAALMPAITDASMFTLTPFNTVFQNTAYAGGAAQLRRDIDTLVQRYYAPFNVAVVDLTAGSQNVNGHSVRAAASLDEVSQTLGVNNADAQHNDGYVLVGQLTLGPNNFDPSGQYGGIATQTDIGLPNTHDGSALALVEANYVNPATFIGLTVAHEAGHTFGLQHTYGNTSPTCAPTAGIDDALLTSDIMSYCASQSGYDFFTRFPLPKGDGNTDDTVALNAYKQLAVTDAADIGPSGVEYVTGTGANDVITITRNSATQATVTVQAFDNSDFTDPITVPGPGPATTTYSYTIDPTRPILVEAGAGNDRIVLDATLGSSITVHGMSGDDQLVVLGNGVGSATYCPGGSAPVGLDGAASFGGSITAGSTSITFSEFETTGSVTIQDVTGVTVVTPFGVDDLTLSSPAAGQNQLSGSSGTVGLVPLTTVNVGRLTVDGASNDTLPGPVGDTISVRGLGAPVTINTGASGDTLTVDLAGGTPLPAGSLTFNGGGGSNRLVVRGSSAYNYEDSTATGAASGTICFGRGPDVVTLLNSPPPQVTFSNVQAVTDTLTLSSYQLTATIVLAPSFAFNGTAAADRIRIGDDHGLPVPQDDLITSDNGGFAPLYFANKANVYVHGLGGTDTLTVNFLTPAAGLSTLTVDGGADNDTLNVQSVASGVALTANGGDGDDQIVVGNAFNNLGTIVGSVTVNGGNQATLGDTLRVEDSGTAAQQTYTVTSTTVGRMSGPTITYGAIEGLMLNAGQGSAVVAGQVVFPGNSITVADLTAATAVTVNGGSSSNDTLYAPNYYNSWAVTGANQGTLTSLLSSNPVTYGHVTFTGVENLGGGTGNDSFQFSPAGSILGHVNGGGGTNTLDYSQYVNPPGGYGGPGVNVALADGIYLGSATAVTGGVSNIQNVYGSHGNDHIYGNSANNTIITYGGVDVIGGGAGDDAIYIYGAQYAGTSIDGGNGNDTLKGNDGDNTWNLTGLDTGDVRDSFGDSAYFGVENLTGGLRSDTFRFSGANSGISGVLNGNKGTDWLDYSDYPGAVAVNLETGSATGVAVPAGSTANLGAAGSVRSIENVLGARKAVNTLTGASTGAYGNAGGNILIGGALNDVLTAGSGNSILIGDGGADQLIANAGTPGFDVLIGGATDFDSATATNLSVLNAFLGVWRNTTAANYASQVALLRDTGVVVNGTTYRLNSSSVHDDGGSADTLTGAGAQAALDWFFQSLNDTLPNVNGSEVVTPV
jgi:Metallo-peptidase family M12/RTX calcium-binding nonapeptide repeat (4 copies)